MQTHAAVDRRELKLESLFADVAVIGGGLAGVCAAITAARAGSKVVLVQDRPVLGGNASSEVRLWILGATSHMGNNNRWAREGGVIDELLVENLYRNPEGNPLILDTILLELVVNEPNLTLLLNAAVHDLEKSAAEASSRSALFARRIPPPMKSRRRCLWMRVATGLSVFSRERRSGWARSHERTLASHSRRSRLPVTCWGTRFISIRKTPAGR